MLCGTVVVALVQGLLSRPFCHDTDPTSDPCMIPCFLISPVIAYSNAGFRADPCPPVPLRFSAPPHIPSLV